MTIITSIIILLDESKSSESTISWLLVIFLLQWIGVLFYILLGINWKKGRIVHQKPEDFFGKYLSDPLKRQELFLTNALENDSSEKNNDTIKTIRLLMNGNNSILTLNNRLKLYFEGRDAFEDIIRDLERAEDSIHMEFFIWRSDILGQKIKNILIKKALEGVDVKLIFDGLGSFGKISFKYRRELKESGIQYKYFLDLNSAVARMKINYRNHRKVVIIDGRKGYTGGMNVGQEYIDGGKRFDTWRDTALRLTGDSVMLLQALFLIDWSSSGNEQILNEKLFPAFHPGDVQIPMQIAVSGPDSRWSSIEQLYFLLLTNANNEVWIQSPYFIPSTSILNAMQTSALSGVKINLMITGIPDKMPPYWAAQTYFETLLESGVRIYKYRAGFLHSKYLVADKEISTVGTCNMDIRSFHINFEVNTVIYDSLTSSRLVDQFNIDLQNCEEITLSKLRKFNIFKRARNSLLSIFSPIM
ncbi:MAG: cardiolipin synthase [Spirochaetaceae bacterium]|nr:cardiolipin synthase [Spirochaetaceae bacterium]